MQQSKLACLLRHLTAKELARFEDYVHSPFFNKHREVQHLCRYFNKYILDEKKQQRLEKVNVFKHLYKDRAFDANLLHGITAKLLVLLHDYLVTISREAHQNNQHYIKILAQLRQRQQFKDYDAVLRKIARNTKHDYTDIEDWYWEKYQLHTELDTRFVHQGGRSYDDNLQLRSNYLDRFFMIKKLKLACAMINRNHVLGSDYTCRFLPELLAYVEHPDCPYTDEPTIQIYTSIAKMVLDQDSDVQFGRIRELVVQHSATFSKSELKNIYDYLEAHCIKQYNMTGGEHYLYYMLEMSKYMVQHQINFINGYLQDSDYKNIGTTAINLGDYEWAETFIESHAHYVLPQHRHSVYSLLMGYLWYVRKAYRKALLTLHDVVFTNYTYHIGAKLIQIKIYYETKESEALYSLSDAFKNYIQRNQQLTMPHKTAYNHFLQLLRHAYRILENRDYWKADKVGHELQKLRQRMEATPVIASRSWLQTQIAALAEPV